MKRKKLDWVALWEHNWRLEEHDVPLLLYINYGSEDLGRNRIGSKSRWDVGLKIVKKALPRKISLSLAAKKKKNSQVVVSVCVCHTVSKTNVEICLWSSHITYSLNSPFFFWVHSPTLSSSLWSLDHGNTQAGLLSRSPAVSWNAFSFNNVCFFW